MKSLDTLIMIWDKFNGKLYEWCSVAQQDFLSAAFESAYEVSRSVEPRITCQNKQHNVSVIPPLEAALAPYNDSRPSQRNLENYWHGFLLIVPTINYRAD